jgi:DNA-binding HxlR family transcriptional regulator
MKESAQSARDKILWVLTNFRGKMTQRELTRRTQISSQELDTILEELEKEGQIVITVLQASRSGSPKRMITQKVG